MTLEERYARLEHEHRELSGVVWSQAQLIGRLEARLGELERRHRDEGGGEPIPNEPPPHY